MNEKTRDAAQMMLMRGIIGKISVMIMNMMPEEYVSNETEIKEEEYKLMVEVRKNLKEAWNGLEEAEKIIIKREIQDKMKIVKLT